MKHLYTNKWYVYLISMCLLLMGSSYSHLKAQSGLNDATFNKPDNITAQGLNGATTASAIQENKLLIAGNFTSYNGIGANRLVRLKNDGRIDPTFNSGAGTNGEIKSIIALPNQKILICGNFTTYQNVLVYGIARLFPNGNIDMTFHFENSGSTSVYLMNLLPDGKILISANNLFLARLLSNGEIDYSFTGHKGSLWDIQKIVVQPDGKILLAGGKFLNGSSNYCSVVRINSDGSDDNTFHEFFLTYGDNPQYVGDLALEANGNILFGSNVYTEVRYYNGHLIRLDSSGNEIRSIPSTWINSIRFQNDGKIIVTGFKYIDNDTYWYILRRSIVRLNIDLSIDSSFVFDDKNTYAHAADATIQTTLIQPDNKIVIGGKFLETSGFNTNNIARINANGSFDESFNSHKGCNGTVLASAVLKSEKILIGGQFTKYDNTSAPNLICLKKNGQPDATFHPGTGTNGKIYSITQVNNKILIGGDFNLYNGYSCQNIARLNADGSFDATFTTTADNVVRKIRKDSLGNIFIAGDFKNINGVPSKGIARLLNGQLDTSFHFKITSFYSPNIYDFALNSGKLYIAVNFKTRVYQPIRAFLLRLFADGSIDSTFNASDEFAEIRAVGVKSNGKPVIAGTILTGGAYTGFVAQLLTNGTLDGAFQYNKLKTYLNAPVNNIDILPNDKLVITGSFSKNNNSILDHIGLLNKNGSLDLNFIGTANGTIYTTALASDDQLVIGGTFTQYSNVVRNGLARIEISIPAPKPALILEINAQQKNVESLSLFPNPAQSLVYVDHLKPGSILKIFNAMGRELYSQTVQNEQTSIELSGFLNGVYFLVYEEQDKRSISKFIVYK